ncbi:MAG: penicillin-binding protein 1C [Kiritimatiellae bacterium]|nr:penicillin-binding protein 1C [Kiritimatiellia bacterium]
MARRARRSRRAPAGGKRRRLRHLARVALLATALAGAGLVVADRRYPFREEAYRTPPASLVLTDRDGRPLRVGLTEEDEYALPIEEIPANAWLPKALIAVEDRRFYRHRGVDPWALLRAVAQNIAGRRVISGASTISTQVIRLVEPRPRTPRTKLIEAFRALQLETRFSKDEILRMYLNRAPFGGNIIGAQSASRRYFGKTMADLSLAEAALLAGLPQSPSRLRPTHYPERARVRRDTVLRRMLACGMITPDQCAAAIAEPVRVRARPYPFDAPHFSAWAQARLPAGAKGVVRTTLDLDVQRAVEARVSRQRPLLDAAGARGAAVVVLDVKNAAVRAMVGSPDPFHLSAHGEVNAAVAPRSAGSTLKPFLYAWAADRGRLSPQRRLMDVPKTWRAFEPGNFDGEYLGPVSAKSALALSLNLPALELAEEAGADRMLALLRTLGFDTLHLPAAHYGLSLALGGGEVRLLSLADAYAALARGGTFTPSRWREDATAIGARRIFSEDAVWMINDMLSGTERQEESLGHQADATLPRAAWKTGTSSGRRDGWCVVWNPEWVIAVWTGDPTGRPCPRLSGGETAAPLAWCILRDLYPDGRGPWYARPAGIGERTVCAVSGCPPGPACADTVMDTAIRGVTDPQPCTVHRRVREKNEQGQWITRVMEHWPPRVAAFLRARTAEVPAPTDASASIRALTIEFPKPGSVFRQTDLPNEQISFRAGAADEPVCWFINGRPLQWTQPEESLAWPLERGRHQVLCADRSGRSASAVFTVE